jgi:hypothetical protein
MFTKKLFKIGTLLVIFGVLLLVSTSNLFAQVDSLTSARDTTYIPLQSVALTSQTTTALSAIKFKVALGGGVAVNDSVVIGLPIGSFKFSTATTDSFVVTTTGHGVTFLQSTTNHIGMRDSANLVLKFTAVAGTGDTVTITGVKVLPNVSVAVNDNTTIDNLTAVEYIGGVSTSTAPYLKRLVLQPGSTTQFVWSGSGMTATGTVQAGSHTNLTNATLLLKDYFGNVDRDSTTNPTISAIVASTGSPGTGTMLNQTGSGVNVIKSLGSYVYNNLAYTVVGTYKVKASATGITTGNATGQFLVNANVLKNVTISAFTKNPLTVIQTTDFTVTATDMYFNAIDNQTKVVITEKVGGGGTFAGGGNFNTGSSVGSIYTTTFMANSNTGTITYTPQVHYTGTVTIQIDAYDTPTGSIVFTTTRNLTVTASDAATLAISPIDTTVAVATTSNFLVQVQDAYANPVTSGLTASLITAAARTGKGTTGTVSVSGTLLVVPYTSVTTRGVNDTVTVTLAANSFQASAVTHTRSGPPATVSIYELAGDSTIKASRGVNTVTLVGKAWDAFGNKVNDGSKLKFSIVTAGPSGTWKSGTVGVAPTKDTISAAIADSIVSRAFYSDTLAQSAVQVGVLYPTTATFATATIKASLNLKVKAADSAKVVDVLSITAPPSGASVTITSQLTDLFGNNVPASDSGSIDYAKILGRGSLAAATSRVRTSAGTVQIVYTTFATDVDTAKITATSRGNSSITDTITIISIPTGTLKTFLVAIASADASKNAGDSVNVTITAQDSIGNRIYTYKSAGQTVTVTGTTFSPVITKDSTFYFSYTPWKYATGSAVAGSWVHRSSGVALTDTLFNQGQAIITLRKFTAEGVNKITVTAGTATGTSANGTTFAPLTSVGQTTWTITANSTVNVNTPFSYTISPRDMYSNVNTTVTNFASVTSNQAANFNAGTNPKIFKGPVTYTATQSAATSDLVIIVTDGTANVWGQSAPITAVAGPTVSGTVTYASATANGIANAMVSLGSLTATTDANGNYSIANVPAGSYTLTASKTGNWGGVNVTDAYIVAKHVAAISLLSGLPLVAADVNASGTVTNTDASAIVTRWMSGGSFLAGDWVFSSMPVTVSTANISSASLTGLAVGDVNASYVPTVAAGSFAKSAVSFAQASQKTVSPKGTFSIPIQVTSEMALGAVSLKINYPSDVVSFKSVSSKLQGMVSRSDEGSVTIGWADMSGANAAQFKANDALVTLEFSAKAQKGTVDLTLDPSSELAGSDGVALIAVKLAAPTTQIAEVPTVFALGQNYPNPFNPSTQISYDLPQAGMVTLTVYNLMGQEVAKLVNEQKAAGSYSVEWMPWNMASGMYIYRINVQTEKGLQTASKRLMLLK